MLKNNFKIALRFLLKTANYSFINIFSLALGLAVVLLIVVFVYREFSYDKFHNDSDRTYLLTMKSKENKGTINIESSFTIPYFEKLKDEIPEISKTTFVNFLTLNLDNGILLTSHNNDLTILGMGFCDDNFIDFFNFNLIAGDFKNAANDPGAIILTENLSKKFFGTTSTIGETIRVNHKNDFIVKAIIEDPPDNSTLQFSGFFSFKASEKIEGVDILYSVGVTNNIYLKLHPNTDVYAVNKKIKNNYLKGIDNKEDRDVASKNISFTLLPLAKIYFAQPDKFDYLRHGNKIYALIMMSLSAVILIIWIINYVNLTIALTTKRTKEIGIKKVNGAMPVNISWQLIMESLIIFFLALILSRIIIESIFSFFNNFLEYKLSGIILNRCLFIAITILGTVIIAIVSSIFPSIYLNKLNTLNILKGEIITGVKGNILRRGLIFFQFLVSIALIICSLLIFKQLNFEPTPKSRQFYK